MLDGKMQYFGGVTLIRQLRCHLPPGEGKLLMFLVCLILILVKNLK